MNSKIEIIGTGIFIFPKFWTVQIEPVLAKTLKKRER